MAKKLYGGRWEIVGDDRLGQGGQAQVFRVRDITLVMPGEYALKRVLNPARHERFRREIEAIRALDHPNVIKLIDHSALDSDPIEEKQFLVMPIATGGNLSDPNRLALLKGSIDAVVNVGIQLCLALQAAHSAKIIHRDVKPDNILFSGNGHEPWISDFGICLLRAQERLTETGEVVGPWAFMAPELEGGSQLDVTAKADIYSLGKVLYFMLSGGTVLPRERLSEPQYNQLFVGERHRLMRALLGDMICPINQRIGSMGEVLIRLKAIEDWEKTARLLPLGPSALSNLSALEAVAREHNRVSSENKDARLYEQERLKQAEKGFVAWLETEFLKVKSVVEQSGVLKCIVGPLPNQKPSVILPATSGGIYSPICGTEIKVSMKTGLGSETHLHIALCVINKFTVTVTHGPPKQQELAVDPPKDYDLSMVPYIFQTHNQTLPQPGTPVSFLTRKEFVGQQRGMRMAPSPVRGKTWSVPAGPLAELTGVFSDKDNMCATFKVSDWPFNQSHLYSQLEEILDVFISVAAKN